MSSTLYIQKPLTKSKTTMATIMVDISPSPFEDAEQLRTAFEAWGTKDDLIVYILAHRNAEQKRLIKEAYYKTYGEDLLKKVDHELPNDFERSILLLTLEPGERDAWLANEAIKKWTPSNYVLMEIACSRDSAGLLQARKAYHARYKKSLEEDVADHTSGVFRELLVALVSSYRYQGPEVNMTLAKKEAKLIHEKFKNKEFYHEDVIRILSTRSKEQIGATYRISKDECDEDFFKLLQEVDGEFVWLLRSTIQCLSYPEAYLFDVLRSAIDKPRTDEGVITRIVTTRAETDLKSIERKYRAYYNIPLKKAIIEATSGYHGKMLVSLFGEDTSEGIYTPT